MGFQGNTTTSVASTSWSRAPQTSFAGTPSHAWHPTPHRAHGRLFPTVPEFPKEAASGPSQRKLLSAVRRAGLRRDGTLLLAGSAFCRGSDPVGTHVAADLAPVPFAPPGTVLTENGSLTIVNLEKDDAGPYELGYWDSVEERCLDFVLVVLDSLPKPEINCNTSDGELVLNCTANFQGSLNYTWKLSNNPHSYRNQELSIPLKNVDITTSATCIIKFSQTERSSEISLIQCLPEGKGDSSHKRHRNILIWAGLLTASIVLVVILEFLHRKGIIKLGTRRKTAQNKSPVNGSGEHEQLYSGNSQQQSNSDGAACSHAVHFKNEEPEADRALNENDRALKGKKIVKNAVNQEEVIQDAGGENGGYLDNST
ncbi:uncharacterized protein LOC103827110 [Serinus canaria]|uniref:uncharacterized protein LOC103827110 n=1 Tax=Serinus canaria TaxID=9135 RepID=UPI0021CC8EAB|nr:uncharacterized protein LOC103827110 [Serinus canaria]